MYGHHPVICRRHVRSRHPSDPWSVSDEWRWLSRAFGPVSFFLTSENCVSRQTDRSGTCVPNILLPRISVTIILYLLAVVIVVVVVSDGKIDTLTAVLFVIQYDTTCCRNVIITSFSQWKNGSIKTKHTVYLSWYTYYTTLYALVGDSDLKMNKFKVKNVSVKMHCVYSFDDL